MLAEHHRPSSCSRGRVGLYPSSVSTRDLDSLQGFVSVGLLSSPERRDRHRYAGSIPHRSEGGVNDMAPPVLPDLSRPSTPPRDCDPRPCGQLVREKPLLGWGPALAIFAGLAILGPFFVADPLKTNPSATFLGPSADHWFGTDNFGRDVFARSVHAARLDLTIGVIIAAIALLIGSAIGVISGYFGGGVDEFVMRFTDVLLAFPGFVLALVIVAALETRRRSDHASRFSTPIFISPHTWAGHIERELE